MTAEGLQTLQEWNWAPSIWLGVSLLVMLYLGAAGPIRSHFKDSQAVSHWQIFYFLFGALIIWFALVSPLDAAADDYLFSAHMLQHLLLTLVAPPLLLLGTPGWMLRPLMKSKIVKSILRVLTAPVLAYLIFNLDFLAWHIPAFYEATLQNESIHIVEHLSFVITATLTWWPVLSPLDELPPLPAPVQILYLFLEGVPTTVLSAIIVFANNVLYPTYAAAPRAFGISALTDQSIAGLVMGMPGGMIYLLALTIVFFRWNSREEKRDLLESGGAIKSPQ
ncbi:MAG: cytochrome c oxidase assembly protein [Anaerolineaceae bacterium]|nr:cytochrome c oxidase assembly protein [Anaerolineaceae bacterium]